MYIYVYIAQILGQADRHDINIFSVNVCSTIVTIAGQVAAECDRNRKILKGVPNSYSTLGEQTLSLLPDRSAQRGADVLDLHGVLK